MEIKTAMVIGHNPGLEELLYVLMRKKVRPLTVAPVHLELPIEQWKNLTLQTKAQLVTIYRPQ